MFEDTGSLCMPRHTLPGFPILCCLRGLFSKRLQWESTHVRGRSIQPQSYRPVGHCRQLFPQPVSGGPEGSSSPPKPLNSSPQIQQLAPQSSRTPHRGPSACQDSQNLVFLVEMKWFSVPATTQKILLRTPPQ